MEIGAHLVPWKLKLCFECGGDGSKYAVEKMKLEDENGLHLRGFSDF